MPYPLVIRKNDTEGDSEISKVINATTDLECIDPRGRAISPLVSEDEATPSVSVGQVVSSQTLSSSNHTWPRGNGHHTG